MSNTYYTAIATAWGGRDGRVASSDERVVHDLSIPKGLGGDDGPGTNPEQLFASGYAACFHSALKLVARQRKIDLSESAVTVHVSLVGDIGAGGLDIETLIEVEMPGIERTQAEELLAAAYATCPYSRATNGNISNRIHLIEE